MTEQAMINVIDKLADKLAVPATEIVNAYMASGVKFLFIFVVLFIFGLINIFIAMKMEDEEASAPLFLFGIGMIIISLFPASDAFLWVTNPKAYAITELIKHLK